MSKYEIVEDPSWRDLSGKLHPVSDSGDRLWLVRPPYIREGNDVYAGREHAVALIRTLPLIEACGVSIPDHQLEVVHESRYPWLREQDLVYQAVQYIDGECIGRSGRLRSDLPSDAVFLAVCAFIGVCDYVEAVDRASRRERTPDDGAKAEPARWAFPFHWDITKPEQFMYGRRAGDMYPRLWLVDTDVQELDYSNHLALDRALRHLGNWERDIKERYPDLWVKYVQPRNLQVQSDPKLAKAYLERRVWKLGLKENFPDLWLLYLGDGDWEAEARERYPEQWKNYRKQSRHWVHDWDNYVFRLGKASGIPTIDFRVAAAYDLHMRY